MHHTRKGDNSYIASRALHLSEIEWYGIFNAFIGHLTSYIVEQFMFDEENRARIAYRRFAHPFDVVARRRHNHFQPWNMGIPRLKQLSVLRGSLRVSARGRTYDNRHGSLATK